MTSLIMLPLNFSQIEDQVDDVLLCCIIFLKYLMTAEYLISGGSVTLKSTMMVPQQFCQHTVNLARKMFHEILYES
jgi:hypothetical protein